jgi:hypothetical protein
MSLTEQIATTIKPILDEHMRESRERIAQLERDINEARAHLEVARAACERLTKQATQHDRPASTGIVYNVDPETREVEADDLVVVRLTRYTAIDARNRTAYLSADRRDVVGKLVVVTP